MNRRHGAGRAGSVSRAAALALALALALSGCVLRQAKREEPGVWVYRLCPDGTAEGNAALTAERAALPEGDSALRTAAQLLNAHPASPELRRAFPEGVELLSAVPEPGGGVRCEMSEAYAALEGIDKTLCACAAAYTLLRLDEVLWVELCVDGKSVTGPLREDGAELGDVLYGGRERLLKLFVPDSEGQGLVSRSAVVRDDGAKTPELLCAEALLDKLAALPEGTRVLSAQTREGLCVVELSEEIYATEPENAATARLLIAAFVETLLRLPGVRRVRLEVNGEPMSSYGSYSTAWPAAHDENVRIGA